MMYKISGNESSTTEMAAKALNLAGFSKRFYTSAMKKKKKKACVSLDEYTSLGLKGATGDL